MKIKCYYIILAFLLTIQACQNEPDKIHYFGKLGVYICNEGGYTFRNAEVSFYHPESNHVTNNLFYSANSYYLGDVAQSIFIQDSTAFIVVNNSAKVEMVKLPSLERIRTIHIPGSSPRYLQTINDSIAYVTDLYAAKIHVINYITGQVVKSIPTFSRWTEHMCYFKSTDDMIVEERNIGDSVTSNSRLIRIDTRSHTIVDKKSIPGRNLYGMAKDVYGSLWVAAGDDSTNEILPVLYAFNSLLDPVHRREFQSYSHHPTNLTIDHTGRMLYYFDNNNIMRFSVDAYDVPKAPFIKGDGRNLYSMGVDPVTGDIYVADALDYIQPSRIYRYDKNGNLLHSFTAGVIAGNFAFTYE